MFNYDADVNHACMMGHTALMYAVHGGCQDTVELLLMYGANPHAKNNKGQSALDMAKHSNQHEISKLLISYGAQQTSSSQVTLAYHSRFFANQLSVAEEPCRYIDISFIT